jgi:type IV secretory pathway TraG/TraD family ATPase VirD4
MIGLTPSEVKASASRLRAGVDPLDPTQHGVLIMETLLSRTPLRMSWEAITLVLAGPRVGKTTSIVVPPIASYHGPVKASSNKPDVHDATRAVREQFGSVWVCDPQQIVGGGDSNTLHPEPAFWWNPLTDVTSLSIARELVQVLVDTTTDPDAKPDAYFHPTAKSTLVNYVFAAALADLTLLHVAGWLADVEDTRAAEILTASGYDTAAQQIRSLLSKPDRQRDGVLGTAQSWLAVTTDPRYTAWITPPPAGTHRWLRFNPATFVRSNADTLYLLSQEGPASASFITTALNASIDRAAIAYARTQPGHRLARPLLSVPDEAANTIRDTTLPDKVSHFGSRGMPTLIVLQSWSQGVEVWGERGMRKLWSAANLNVYLGGVSETEFLKSMSELLGDRDERHWTRSRSRNTGGTSTTASEQIRRVPIMSPAELASLPRGRALLFSSGNRPALGRPVPWITGPHAEAIQASLRIWESDEHREQRTVETADVRRAVGEAERSDRILLDSRLAAALTHEGVNL